MKQPGNNNLIQTLVNLKGNPRACVYTEPLWGLSINLCLPYASVYMVALGLTDSQVGLTATIYMLSQVMFAFLSGPITDKMGRRKATAVFDFIAWSIPCLIWLRAEGLWFFIVAALLNGAMQVPTNSWDCLLIEDAEKKQITGIHSLVTVFGQLSFLFAPISAVLFSRLTLVPAIRILYINAFVLMTLKVLLLYIFSRETKIGLIRLEASRGKSLFSLAAGYSGVLKIIGKSQGTIFALVITILTGIVALINTTFWPVFVSKKLLVPDHLLPMLPIIRSMIAIVFFFLIVPHLTKGHLKLPLLTGFICYGAGQVFLILAPDGSPATYIFLCIALVFDGFGASFMLMLAKSLTALHVNPAERARVQAIMNMIIMAVTAPFGWIGGLLSGFSRSLPFILNLCCIATGLFVVIIFYRSNPDADKALE
ncbi:MAG: MFS transporter [Treponema sp.]|nr:MFS transporter [Treponema sp.]